MPKNLVKVHPDRILDSHIKYYCYDPYDDTWEIHSGLELNIRIYNGQRLKYAFNIYKEVNK